MWTLFGTTAQKLIFNSLFKYVILFIYFIFGCAASSLLHRLPLAAESRGYSPLQCSGFSLQWLLLLQSKSSRATGFSSCGSQALEHSQQLSCTGLVAPPHGGSSQTSAQTCVSCIGRWILYHRTTRGTLNSLLKNQIHLFLNRASQHYSK